MTSARRASTLVAGLFGALIVAATACGDGELPPLAFDSTTVAPAATSGADGATTTTTVGGVSTAPAGPTTTVAALAPWVDATANLAGLASECGNLSVVSAHPTRDEVIASVALDGLFVSRPDSNEWEPLGTGAGSAAVANRGAVVVFDPDDPQRFWESGAYAGPGAVRTADGGATFEALGDVEHLDALSVDLTDPQRRTILVGAHERPELYRSTDGGATFTDIAGQLPADLGELEQPLVLGETLHLLGTHSAPNAGIYRTTDGGTTWEQVFEGGVYRPPLVSSADGSIFWLTERGGLVRSEDDGETWTLVAEGGLRAGIVELADGRLASLSGGNAVASSDQGATWRSLGAPGLPYDDAFGLTYSPSRNALYAWRWDCTDVVPAGAIQRLDLPSS